MGRRMWLNLALLVLVATLAWIAYEEPGLHAPQGRTSLTALTPDRITRISITRPGKEDLVFKRERGWWMRSPLQVAANVLRIDSVLGIAQAQWRGQYDVADLDLKKYGLDEPLATLFLNDVKIEFGANEALKRQRYVRMGAHVYVINDTLYYQLQAPPAAYVALALLPPGNEIMAITLPGLALVKEQGRWRSSADGDGLAATEMDALADAWQHAQASRVTPYGNETVQGEIVLRLSQAPLELRLGILQREPELIVARKDIGMRYHFSAEQTRHLLPAVANGGG